MRIQFEIGKPSHGRHFEGVIDELVLRGHEVITTACVRDCPGYEKYSIHGGDHRELLAFEANVRDDGWGPISYALRTARDYLRYLLPQHAGSLIIKSRARNMLKFAYNGGDSAAGDALISLLDSTANDAKRLLAIDHSLACFEEMIPPHPGMLAYVDTLAADILCITPMLMTQYGQTDFVKAARALGKPIVLLVGSWDNLTTKGTTHVVPDMTLVWNDIQRQECVEYHGLPPGSIRVVGAARFDEFWDRKIEIGRGDFCYRYGLDPEHPIITYLGSSNLIVRDEKRFVTRWIAAVRACANPLLANANLLLRPHPKFSSGWADCFQGGSRIGVVASDKLNNDPILYHCLAHARAVVAANTSAELEAAIVGRPIFTIRDPAFATGMEGTIHFRYLADTLSATTSSLEEHIRQLSTEISKSGEPERNLEFLASFLRPGGLNKRAALVTVDAIEEAGRSKTPSLNGLGAQTTRSPNGLSRLMTHLMRG